jgi:hypothetical protein
MRLYMGGGRSREQALGLTTLLWRDRCDPLCVIVSTSLPIMRSMQKPRISFYSNGEGYSHNQTGFVYDVTIYIILPAKV